MKDINARTVKLDCLEVNKVSPYIDGNLSVDRKKSFDKHIQSCEFCQNTLNKKVKQLKAIEELIPMKHLSIKNKSSLDLEIEKTFEAFRKKSNIGSKAKKLIDKVVDLF